MIRRSSMVVVRLVAALVAGLAVLAGFAAWRLAEGPVSLDALTPYVAQRLAGTQGDLVVSVDHTLLSLGDGANLELLVRGVHLSQRQGAARLTLPELSLGFSMRAALRGVFAPTRVVVHGLELWIERDADRSFRFGLGEAGTAAQGWGEDLLRNLAGLPDQRGPWGYLTEVAVRGAALSVDDRALGVVWRARRADATLFRGSGGLHGHLALAVAVGGQEAEIRGEVGYRPASSSLTISLGFNDLQPASFAAMAPALAPLSALRLPIAGQVRAELDTAGLGIRNARCELSFGRGEFDDARFVGGAFPVASGTLRAAYDPAAGRVTVEQLMLDIGGPRIEATGTVDGVGDGIAAGALPTTLSVAAALRILDLPVDDLPRLWPSPLSPAARSWTVQHVHDGTVTEAQARLRFALDLAGRDAQPARLGDLQGTLAYRGLTIEYLQPLPPARKIDGTASFDRAHIDFLPAGGGVQGLQLLDGAVKLAKLDGNDEELAIELTLRGPVRDALQILDSKPLQYASELKLDPAHVAGNAEAQLAFKFPLAHDLKFSQVEFGAKATLTGVGLEQVVFGRDLADGNFELRLDRAALRLEGAARLDGVPATLSWTQSLKPNDPVRTHYLLRTRLDDAARRRFELDPVPDMVSGAVDVELDYSVKARKRGQAAVTLDLQNAKLDVAKLGWTKAAGMPATARLELDIDDDHVSAVRQAVVKGAGLEARLAATFAAGGAGLTRIDVERLVVGDTDLAAVVTRRPEGGWRVVLNGMSLDATALANEVGRSPTAEAREPPLIIEAKLGRLVLGPKREARAVSGQLYSDGLHWQAASFDASTFGGGKASLRFGQVAGDRSLRLTTSDFGALLRLLDISDNVAGGQFELDGVVGDDEPRRVLRGHAEAADYRVVGAPLFARLLSLASFSGIGALLSGEGIPFTRLKADIVYDDGRIAMDNLRAYGGAIGINASGVVDRRTDTLDMSGTLVPAYAINSVLGNIPVLGKLLLGGEGEGIFGANFRVAGPVSDARISVNPLSALAPGVLRRLFLFDPGDPTKQ